MKRVFHRIFLGLGLLFTLFTCGSLAGQFHWTFDLLSHYHLQYTVGLALCLLILLLLRDFRFYLLGVVAAFLVNLMLVIPFFLPIGPIAQAATAAAPLRVMALNISTSNAGYGQVVELIRERQPDLVFMSEVREDLLVVLREELTDKYPYLHAEPSRMTLGVAFLSRQPFQEVETVIPGGRGRRYLRAVLDWQGQPVTIVGIHPLPPINGDWAASRNSEIALMGQLANEATQPFMLLGDLNASPWSQPMRQLIANTELRYAMQGYGIGLTWRLAGVLLGAPLDYILVSPAWHVVNYVEGGDIRSDHIPVQADLMLEQE
ncbi:MAG: endonuclease/exonuclease/phosphatase family protein [Caldilinea sp. CFX5]|nr:endonuclease/exonuclease/phosphatase family protein [Caldilinea sp. CFX5]